MGREEKRYLNVSDFMGISRSRFITMRIVSAFIAELTMAIEYMDAGGVVVGGRAGTGIYAMLSPPADTVVLFGLSMNKPP